VAGIFENSCHGSLFTPEKRFIFGSNGIIKTPGFFGESSGLAVYLPYRTRKRDGWQRRQAGGGQESSERSGRQNFDFYPSPLNKTLALFKGLCYFQPPLKFSGSRPNLFQVFWNCRFIEILLSIQESRFFAIIF